MLSSVLFDKEILPIKFLEKIFNSYYFQCESLLKCMGVCCIKGRGEAEATCAVLNSQGVCI